MKPGSQFNPFARSFLENPYPEYHRLRQDTPVYRSVTGSWILTRHDDIRAVLNDHARFNTADTPARIRHRSKTETRTGKWSALHRFLDGFFLFADSPQHARLAGPARQAFSGLDMAALPALVDRIITSLLDEWQGLATVDLVQDFAEPIAGRTIGRLMGITDSDCAKLQGWCHQFSRVLDSMLPLEHYDEINEAASRILNLLDELIASGPDPATFLGQLQLAAKQLPAELLAPISAGIFFAGQETAVNAISTAAALVTREPDLRATLAAQTEVNKGWVHEFLRFESPVQVTVREPKEDLVIRGQSIRAGERVVLYLGAANRDPAVFTDPDRLDLSRDARAHLAFSSGAHRCLGAHLATLEMQRALPTLFRRFPDLAAVDQRMHWRPNVTIRGLLKYNVTLTPASLQTS